MEENLASRNLSANMRTEKSTSNKNLLFRSANVFDFNDKATEKREGVDFLVEC